MVVAAGECGLDYFRNFSPPAEQRRAFELQLGLAARLDKPLFLHQRDARADFLAMLRAHPGVAARAVLHCFTEGPDMLEECLALGLSIGVTGWICDERRGEALREAAPRIPADRLMLETDAPYLLPRTLRPKPPAAAQRARVSCGRARGNGTVSRRVDGRRWRARPPTMPAASLALHWPTRGNTQLGLTERRFRWISSKPDRRRPQRSGTRSSRSSRSTSASRTSRRSSTPIGSRTATWIARPS